MPSSPSCGPSITWCWAVPTGIPESRVQGLAREVGFIFPMPRPVDEAAVAIRVLLPGRGTVEAVKAYAKQEAITLKQAWTLFHRGRAARAKAAGR